MHKRLSVHYKITIIFTISITIVLGGTYFYLNKGLRLRTLNRIEANLAKEAAFAGYVIDEYVQRNGLSYDIDDVADNIGRLLGLRVTVIGADGVVFADSQLDGSKLHNVENHLFRPEVQDVLSSGSGTAKRFSTTVKKNMLYVAMPFGHNRTIGMVRLSMPLEEIALISNKLKETLLIWLITAFVIAIIICYMLSALVSNPIRSISESAISIAGGDFSKRLPEESNDEIGDLAKSFNYMSEQIKAKIEQVTESKTRLEAVFSSMFDGIIILNKKGNIVLINAALKGLLKPQEGPIGKKPIEVMRNIDIQDIADSVLMLDKGIIKREIEILTPDQKIFFVHATPIKVKENTEGAVLVFHDITELRRLENIRKDFIANASHELRTPVSNIKGYAETLLDGALQDKKNAKDFVKIIYSDSERLAELIKDLLDLSKIESGKISMKREPFSIRKIAEEAVSQSEKKAKDKAISFIYDIPETLSHVLVDKNKIGQVFFNLFDNAIKYSPVNGTITISAEDEGQFIKVAIIDKGAGIPEKDLPRIFERFYRVDKGRLRELGGTGLGLSIVKHIIEAHRGKVFAESTEGKGSSFGFYLPKV